jgi:xanthine dehydrogenase accessory factor
MRADVFAALQRCIHEERAAVLATVVAGPGAGRQLLIERSGATHGDLGAPELNDQAGTWAHARPPLAERAEKVAMSVAGSPIEVFLATQLPRPQLVVVGAVHVAVALVTFARLLGFRTVVIDPRPVFATPARFAHADQLLVEWPQDALSHVRLTDNTCLTVLSHDSKIDTPALALALRQRLPYIGALGSPKTQRKRVEALREEGFGPEDIGRIRSPIGLDLGGRRAEEVALAIIAEIVAVKHGTRDSFGTRQGR